MAKRGFDFDDVLFDTNRAICRWHNAHFNTRFTRDDIKSYHLDEIWGVSREEGIRRVFEFYHSKEHAETELLPGVARLVPRLMERDELVIVSARPNSVLGHTQELLARHFPALVDSLYLTNRFGVGPEIHKSELCTRFELESFVDDAQHHDEDVATVVRQPILFETPWNRSYAATLPPHRRVRSWHELAMRLL